MRCRGNAISKSVVWGGRVWSAPNQGTESCGELPKKAYAEPHGVSSGRRVPSDEKPTVRLVALDATAGDSPADAGAFRIILGRDHDHGDSSGHDRSGGLYLSPAHEWQAAVVTKLSPVTIRGRVGNLRNAGRPANGEISWSHVTYSSVEAHLDARRPSRG